jgi:hypothetical protein
VLKCDLIAASGIRILSDVPILILTYKSTIQFYHTVKMMTAAIALSWMSSAVGAPV